MKQASLLCCIFLFACADPSVELAVEVTTDFSPGVEFVVVEILIDGVVAADTAATTADTNFQSVRNLRNFVGLMPASTRTVMVRLLDASRELVSEQSVLLDNSQDAVYRAVLSRACAGVVCDGNTTCLGGNCVDPKCFSEGSCAAECTSDGDCVDPNLAMCASPLCIQSVCLFPATDNCQTEEWCSPEQGCLAISSVCVDDVNCDDGSACTLDSCAEGRCSQTPDPTATLCAGGVCRDGACLRCQLDEECPDSMPSCGDDGACQECAMDVDCAVEECRQASCDAGRCVVAIEANGVLCSEGTCSSGQCVPAECNDNIKNGDETDLDCGGLVCAPCQTAQICVSGTDCQSKVCSDALCLAATCVDGVLNGAETEIDCGGDVCAPCDICDSQTDIERSDCAALRELYNSTGGVIWGTDWFKSNTPCTWSGITCASSRVVEIRVANDQIFGTLPDALGDLSALTKLTFSADECCTQTGLTGEIPATLVNLTQLRELNLGLNRLSGDLPAFLGQLPALSAVLLYGNRFSGVIPASWGGLPALKTLDLSGNAITGVDAGLVGASAIEFLYLNNNALTTLPSELSQLSGLRVLQLHQNAITGSIPPVFGALNSLQVATFNNNMLSGEVPSALVNQSSLMTLQLHHNGCLTVDTALQSRLASFDSEWNCGCDASCN